MNDDGRIKLLMGITLSEMGGAQKVVYDIISSLPNDRYELTLVTYPGGELIQWVRDLKYKKDIDVRIIEVPQLRRELSPFYDLCAFLRLYSIMEKGRYDIAHFHSSKMGILGRLAAHMAGVPKIYFTVHGWGINEYQPKWLQGMLGFAERVAGRRCTMCMCVSNYHMDMGLRHGWLEGDRACVIYNGIDEPPASKGKLPMELQIGDEMPIIGTVMRLREPKQPVYTIEVFNEVLKRGYRAKLVIVGDGPMRADCENAIERLGLEEDVYMLGTRLDARELINDMDIVVMFSKWEGLPISIIEGMFAAKPVVVSRVGGIPEIVSHGIDGYVIDGFSIQEGADYICTLLEDKELRACMGGAGKEKAMACFSKGGMVKAYERIYREGKKY